MDSIIGEVSPITVVLVESTELYTMYCVIGEPPSAGGVNVMVADNGDEFPVIYKFTLVGSLGSIARVCITVSEGLLSPTLFVARTVTEYGIPPEIII